MKFAFLPYYFKKIGIIGIFAFIAIIITTSIVTTIQAYAGHGIPADGTFTDGFRLGFELGASMMLRNYWITQLCGILILVSIACYMLAKEKIDDEYMDAMRWESLRLALIISIGITIVCILLNVDLAAKPLLLLQFLSYLIVFKIKKSRNLNT